METMLAVALAVSPVAVDAAPPGDDAPYMVERSLVTRVPGVDGHSYRLLISWPEGAPPAKGWPVLYLLDGDDNFAIATEAARRLARAGARSGIESGIVVGIDSGSLGRRVLDYTPRAGEYRIPAGFPAHGLATGGADAFVATLAERVVPFVARRWRVDSSRQTLAGHSFGGLLTLHAAAKRPELFSAYAAVSPSLWFGNGTIAFGSQEGPAVAGRRFLVAIGTGEGGPNATSAPAAEALAGRLESRGADARFLELGGQSHGTSMLGAMGAVIALAFGREPQR